MRAFRKSFRVSTFVDLCYLDDWILDVGGRGALLFLWRSLTDPHLIKTLYYPPSPVRQNKTPCRKRIKVIISSFGVRKKIDIRDRHLSSVVNNDNGFFEVGPRRSSTYRNRPTVTGVPLNKEDYPLSGVEQ